MQRKHITFCKNENGLLSIDFLFGIFVTFVSLIFLLRVCYTLVMVEVAQYIAFSTARAHATADVDMGAQRNAGMQKYKTLVKNPLWANSFVPGGSFELAKPNDQSILRSGPQSGAFDEYLNDDSDGSKNVGIPFIGVKLPMKLKWLNMKVPYLGATADADEDFQTYLTAFLLREPSMDECKKFMLERYDRILNDDTSFNLARPKSSFYVPMEDNGC